MGLNIKNERVHELARAAARRTGRTQTGVIEMALERLLADLDRPVAAQKRARMDLALASFDVLLTDDDRAELIAAADQLYDDRGLPA